MLMGAEIIVIGSSNTDFIMKMDHLPSKGETVTNASFMQTYGGKGANTAIGAARAGGRVTFVNCVGDDRYADLIIENMGEAGICTDYMIRAGGIASGSALVMIDEKGDNYLSVAPGSNYRLLPEHIYPLREKIAQAGMVLLQFEILPETLYAAVDVACEVGVPVLFNYAPAREVDVSVFDKVSILVVNEVEAEVLCGFTLESDESVRKAIFAMQGLGVETVVITLGSRGVVAGNRDGILTAAAYPVDVVDTTAAGDIFCGSLAAALVEGKGLAESMQFANASAAISVTRLGAQPSAPLGFEIDRFLNSRPTH
jgi:ribokinase